MLRKRRGLSAGGGTPDAAARQLWFCIGTITTGIFAADLLQEQQAQSINSRLGCSVTPIGSAVRDLMKDLRHVVMAAQCDGEFRLCCLDHLPIVGERGAAKLFGAFPGDPRSAVGDTDNVAPNIPQNAQIRGVIDRMPMTDLGDGDALWDGHGGSPARVPPLAVVPENHAA
jgi:hypothetical protein